jgi:maleylpyruvate isomerase
MAPTEDIANVAAATARLLDTLRGLSDAELGEASSLPGWTRAHVLTHLARNSDGMRNLLLSARTGVPIGLYASRAVRNADIETGATRPVDAIRDDIGEAPRRLAVEVEALPEHAWGAMVEVSPGAAGSPTFPATGVLGFRIFEVEVHHVDLAAGYEFSDIPAELRPAFISRAIGLLGERATAADLEATDAGDTWQLAGGSAEMVVSGASANMLAWLLGRSEGRDLQAVGAGSVPDIPNLT